MPAPLSSDLRTRIVRALKKGKETQLAIADRLEVGVASVVRLARVLRENRSIEPRKPGGGNPRILTVRDLATIRRLVEEQPTATVNELAAALAAAGGPSVHRSTVTRALKELGITRKKTTRASTGRARPTSRKRGPSSRW